MRSSRLCATMPENDSAPHKSTTKVIVRPAAVNRHVSRRLGRRLNSGERAAAVAYIPGERGDSGMSTRRPPTARSASVGSAGDWTRPSTRERASTSIGRRKSLTRGGLTGAPSIASPSRLTVSFVSAPKESSKLDENCGDLHAPLMPTWTTACRDTKHRVRAPGAA